MLQCSRYTKKGAGKSSAHLRYCVGPIARCARCALHLVLLVGLAAGRQVSAGVAEARHTHPMMHTHSNESERFGGTRWVERIIHSFQIHLEHVHANEHVVCCSVLQCVAVCCNVLQCVAVCCSVLQCVVVCCSALQCAAVCCGVLQCVAVKTHCNNCNKLQHSRY